MKQYKALFLDWDDTIGDFRQSEQCALRDMFAEFKLNRWFETLQDYVDTYRPHNRQLWHDYAAGKVSKDFLMEDRFTYPLLHSPNQYIQPANGETMAEMARRMSERFLELTNHYFTVLPGAAEMVRTLARQYPLTIISNGFVESQNYKLAHSNLADCFTHVLLSEQVGISKPDTRIFEMALRLNRVKCNEALMIGDAFDPDIIGAQRAGIDQLWYHPSDEPINEQQTATYIVKTYAEITDILAE